MNGNLILSIITILLSAFFFVISLTNPVRSSTMIGPNDWPNTVLLFTMGMGVLQLLKALRKKKILQEDDKEKEEKGNLKHWIIAGELALYLIALPYLGFITATFLVMAIFFSQFGMKKRGMNLAGAFVGDVLCILLFANLLNITLPRGIGIFERLSFLFY